MRGKTEFVRKERMRVKIVSLLYRWEEKEERRGGYSRAGVPREEEGNERREKEGAREEMK